MDLVHFILLFPVIYSKSDLHSVLPLLVGPTTTRPKKSIYFYHGSLVEKTTTPAILGI
jgi:hypothetical protein